MPLFALSPVSPTVLTRRVSAAVALTAALVLSGCGGSDEPSANNGTSAPDKTSAPAHQASGSVDPTNEKLPVLATREGALRNAKLRLEINELKRSSNLVNLTFTAHNLETTEKWNVADSLDGGRAKGFTISGVSLHDAANQKKHPVALDSEGNCVCTRNVLLVGVEPGKSYTFSATFGAPPVDVKTLDVNIPGFGTFNSVPLG